jgi:hypothetical protein
MTSTAVNRRYAEEFTLSIVSFRELIDRYGYHHPESTHRPAGGMRWYDGRSARRLMRKFLTDLATRQCRPTAAVAYLKPISRKAPRCAE